jgi:ubiquinol-cytochrome c reductase cytochrome b/c1 subunit
MRYSRKNSLIATIDEFVRTHKAPITITYMWNFGVYSLFCLIIQIVTGLLLSTYYVPSPDEAFDSVEKIIRDVNYGWLLRYIHSNGASFFFIAVYIHMFRGLYYTSFIDKKRPVWYVGALIFFVMIVTAFLGYVLPWGQISYWGAIVITNFFSAVPYVGESLVQ